jgi:hypothetical protein
MTYSNLDVYNGTFNNGRRDGNGTYIMKDLTKYEGDWKDD